MTFDEWWGSLTTREQNGMDRDGAMAAWEFGKLEAAEQIRGLWDSAWPVAPVFYKRLKLYVEGLK